MSTEGHVSGEGKWPLETGKVSQGVAMILPVYRPTWAELFPEQRSRTAGPLVLCLFSGCARPATVDYEHRGRHFQVCWTHGRVARPFDRAQ